VDTPFFKNQILKDFLKEIDMNEGKLFFINSIFDGSNWKFSGIL